MSKPAENLKPFKIQLQQRTAARVDLRPSDGIKASLLLPDHTIEVRLFDVSPTGIGIIVAGERIDKLPTNKEIDLKVSISGQPDLRVRGIIKWSTVTKENLIKAGIQFVQHEPCPDFSTERHVISVPEYVFLTGYLYKPYMFYERAPLRIEKICKHSWRIKIFDPEILAIPGVHYSIYLNTAKTARPTPVRVKKVVEATNDSVILDVEVNEISSHVTDWISHNLIFDGGLSPVELRNCGLKIKRLANGLKFRYIKNQEDYEKVLELRYRAYKFAGKVKEDKSPSDMAAPLDPISRIIAAYHGDRIVGSVAVAFPMDEETLLDTERPFKSGYPKKIPSKSTVVEVARLCTDPEYRESDLMIRLLEHIYKAMRCGNREVVITSTDDKLWPVYKKIGFKKTGMSYDHPYLAGIKHHIITQAAPQADSASNINPLFWNFAWRDMSHHLYSNSTIKRTFLTNLKVRLFEKIGKVLKINQKKLY